MKKLLSFAVFLSLLLPLNVSAQLRVGQGGTGTTSPSGILYGDNGTTLHLNTVGIGSGLTFVGGVLSAPASGGASSTLLMDNNSWTGINRFLGTTTNSNGDIFSQQSTFIVSTTTKTGQYTDLQSALNALPSTGGKIHVRCGTYTLSASTTIAGSHITIEGEGDCTQFNFDGTSVNPAFNTNNSSQRTDDVFKDFLINQTSVGGAGTAINGSNFARSTFDHVNITGANIGMDFASVNALYNRIQDPLISVQGTGAIGIRFTSTANDNQVYSPRIVADANTTGFYFDSHSNTCYSCDVETGALVGIDITANANNTTLVNPYLEANQTNLRLASGVQSVTMIGGYISTGSTANITDNGAVGFAAVGTRVQFLPVNYYNGADFGLNTINQQFRLEVGSTTAQNVARINGVSSANGAPVLSIFRKGSAEWVLAGGGGASSNFSIGANPAGGGLTDTDTNLLNAAKLTLTTAGNTGIGTTTPWGKLALSLNSADTNIYAFTIASSTASATSTLFQVSNTGSTTILSILNVPQICLSGDCKLAWPTGGSGVWPFTIGLTNYGVAVQATTTPEWFQSGVMASTTAYLELVDVPTGWIKSVGRTFAYATSSNTILGFNAGGNAATTTAQMNEVAIGDGALQVNTGADNTAIGHSALLINSSGASNTAIGSSAGAKITTGTNNVAVGAATISTGANVSQDTAIGSGALNITSGINNTAVGYNALTADQSGFANTAVGDRALSLTVLGSRNTALGDTAGITNASGVGNTLLGYAANVSSNNLSTSTAVGAGATVDCSNCLVLGGTGLNFANVGIGTTSPTNRFEVSGNSFFGGNLTATGTIKFTALTGLSCLGTDGSGNLQSGTCSGGSGVWPFTTGLTNFGTSTQATTTPEWFKLGLFASSTSQFDNASTTFLTASNFWMPGQSAGCAQYDANGKLTSTGSTCGSSSSIWPFTTGLTNFATSTQATTTPEWFKMGLYASSTSQFANASTTLLTVSNTAYFGDGTLSSSTLSASGGTNKWWNFGSYKSTQAGNGNFIIASSSNSDDMTTNQFFVIDQTGKTGIGTSTPGSLLSLNALANFTTATSSFYSTGGINLIGGGCFAINGTCVSGSGGGVSSVTGTYPVVSSGGATPAISLAFGTTTANTWSGLQTFTNVGTTTFSGGLDFTRFNLSATSTGSFGINLSGGCFAVNGTCITGGGAGTPGGSNTQLQFNDSSAFNGASLLTYDKTNLIFSIGSSTPWLANSLTLSSTTPVLADELVLATSTSMSLGIPSSTLQHIDYSTSAVTITVSAYKVVPGESTKVITCGPNSGTGGAITWAAAAGIHLAYPANVQPGNTTQASSCDQWFLTVDKGPLGTTTPWIMITQAPGFI